MKQPLVIVEFTKELDDMTDDEIDELAAVIADSMREQLKTTPPTD